VASKSVGLSTPPGRNSTAFGIGRYVAARVTVAARPHLLTTTPSSKWCTQLLPQETYFSRRGGDFDMFPKYTYDLATTVDRCASEYAVAPKPTWISQSYGGNAGVAVASNIVFSNGELDPWRAGGVDGSVVNSTDRDVWAITIPQGAHHLDLMFSNADDPDGVHDARNFEMECAKRWLGLDS